MPQRGRSVRHLAGSLLALAVTIGSSSGAQDRVQLNSISKVEVKGRNVEITGTRRPNFTTFTLTDPARLVIDVSEAVFAGVPAEQKIGNGTITAIKTQSFGSESAAIARIVIGFENELETDIATSGTSLIVKLPVDATETARAAAERVENERLAKKKADDEARAAKEAAAAEALAAKQKLEAELKAAKEKAAQELVAKAEAEKAAKLERERLARDEKDRAAKEKAEQIAAVKAAREEKARLAQEEAAQKKASAETARSAKLDSEKSLKEQAEAARLAKLDSERSLKERLEAERLEKAAAQREEQARLANEAAAKARLARLAREEKLEREKADREAKAQALRDDEEQKKLKAAEKVGAVADAKVRKKREAAEKKRADEEAKLERVRLAREAKAAKEADEKRKREAARAAEQNRIEAEQAERIAAVERVAEQEQLAAEREKQRRQRDLDVAAAKTPPPEELARGSSRITYVGFKQDNGRGRIYLRTSAPAKYSVGEDNKRNVVVTLENTRISLPNNQRMLDTSFFDTAVSLVRPEELSDDSVRVTISLKKRVAYKASQAGNELTLEFERAD